MSLNLPNRMGRLEFLTWMAVFYPLLLVLSYSAGLVAGIAVVALGGNTDDLKDLPTVLAAAVYVLLYISYLVLIVPRRCHDMGQTGYRTLELLIPIWGLIFLSVLFSYKGTAGDNRFGAPPSKRLLLWSFGAAPAPKYKPFGDVVLTPGYKPFADVG